MLSDDMTRFVDLHRGLGFKFRTQHGLLRAERRLLSKQR
jgi:hypothetical protein